MSRIVCKDCGKVWQSGTEYMTDDIKCGNDLCPHTSGNQDKAKASVQALFSPTEKIRRFKGAKVETTVNSIPNDDYDKNADSYYIEVDKVIHTTMKRIK